jgi:hypothetical protein
MRRLLATALPAAILCMPTYRVAHAKPSQAVKQILDKTVRDVKRNLLDFQKANKEPLSEARQDLQELAKKLVDDRKEDEAKKVLEQIETLEDDVMREAKAPPLLPPQLPEKPLLARFVGKWKCPNHPSTFVVELNGDIHEDHSKGAVLHRGQLKDLGDGTAEAVQENKWRWRVREAGGNGLAIQIFNPEGKPQGCGIILERIP